MRLINADALLVKQANIAKTFARSDAQKSLMGRVMYNTEHAPAIDAIPVEWLAKKRDVAIWQFAGAIDWLLGDWQKEQGTR